MADKDDMQYCVVFKSREDDLDHRTERHWGPTSREACRTRMDDLQRDLGGNFNAGSYGYRIEPHTRHSS